MINESTLSLLYQIPLPLFFRTLCFLKHFSTDILLDPILHRFCSYCAIFGEWNAKHCFLEDKNVNCFEKKNE